MSTDIARPDCTDPEPTLQRLFGDSPKAMILQVLFERPELTSQQLADHTGFDRDILRRATADLEAMGVIDGERDGRVHYWRLRLNTPAEDAIEVLMDAYGPGVDR